MPRRKVQAKSPSWPSRIPFVQKLTGHSEDKRRKFIHLTLEGVNRNQICQEHDLPSRTAERWWHNILRYGSISIPFGSRIGRPYTVTIADENALLEALLEVGWMYLDEIAHWLLEERGVEVSKSSIHWVLKRNSWTRKTLRVMSNSRSEPARNAYLEDISQFAAEQLVFLDETIFNEKTGWRHRAWAPIGEEARYATSVKRGKTHSCLAAMGIKG